MAWVVTAGRESISLPPTPLVLDFGTNSRNDFYLINLTTGVLRKERKTVVLEVKW